MVTVYPVPEFETACSDYTVYAEGHKLHVYRARVSAMPTNQVFRGEQRATEETEISGFVVFEGEREVQLRVKVSFYVFSAKVVPQSNGVAVRATADEVVFTLPGPGNYVLEVNGTHKPLHIFFNEPEIAIPDSAEPNVIYYGAGIHRAGVITLKSGQSLYLAPGAHVYGCVEMDGAQDVHIYGRGILDASDVPRMDAGFFKNNGIRASHCRHVVIEGIIIQDTPVFAIAAGYCEHFDIRDVKIIGEWRYNSDGIDMFNSSHMRVSRCFIRTFDDSVCIKGNNWEPERPDRIFSADILVEDCVIWNDWGRALEIGADTLGDEIHSVTFRNCDILHFLFIACDVQACGDAYVHDIAFSDIRVGEPLDPQCEPRLTEVFIRPMCWIPNVTLGRVSDIRFENVRYTGRTVVPNRYIGYAQEHDIRNVTLSGIQINGRLLPDGKTGLSYIISNEFTSGIILNGRPLSPESVVYESEQDTQNKFLIGNGAFITL